MKKTVVFLAIILMTGLPAIAQNISFGLRAGANYSYYHLSNRYVFHETDGAGIGFHGGVFAIKNFGVYFAQADANFIYGMKGTVSFRGDESEISKLAVTIPMSLGRYLLSDQMRLYAGLVPAYYFGADDIQSFLQNNHLNAPGSYGGGPGLGYLIGSGVLFSKLSVDIRYEGNILGGFFSVSRDPSILTNHRFSHLLVSLGFRLN